MIKIFIALCLATFTVQAYAIGATIALALVAEGIIGAGMAATITAMAINMVVAVVVSKAFFNPQQSANNLSGASPNPGNRQQITPATDNKLPVVYGSAYVGGTITDLCITENNQTLYYILAICEVTNSNSGQSPDSITFGNVYYGGKKVIFNSTDLYKVDSLLDETTMVYDTTVAGKMEIYTYANGSNNPTNSSISAITVLSDSDIVASARWDSTKLMSNCAFAIIKLTYSQSANIRGIEQTKFQVTNSRTNTGDCFYDYLINTRYGAAISLSQIDTTSLDALTTYSNENFTYINSAGSSLSQPRFKFNGVIDTTKSIMDNLQDMTACCDCQLKYNEVTAQWGVIVQKPTYTVAMALNDSNMVSAITITPLDIASSYNIVECKFPDSTQQDAFNSASFNLSTIAPALLYPNEPVNKASLSLPLTNNSVTAQYIANRLLKAGREDLQVSVDVNYVGIQLDAGDIVTITNSNYGWVDKLFRINKLVQQFADDGAIIVKLNLSEYNPAVYDDVTVTQFKPNANTGIGDPTFFGIPEAPVVVSHQDTATNPYLVIQTKTTFTGIVQYAEIWYSAYSNPLATQMYFAGTSEIQSNGTPWSAYTTLPNITLSNIPAGNWYFFSRMVNSLASSSYSPASTLLQWRPSTYQFIYQYISVAYATSITGTGFNLSPRSGATYYGLCNQTGTAPSTNPADYTWYPATAAFSTNKYILYCNRGGRKFSFDQGFADYALTGGKFIPTSTSVYDPTIWQGLEDGTNVIDLDQRTGQLIQQGTTSYSSNDGQIKVTNNDQGGLIASLDPFLQSQFGDGVNQVTSSAALITVDKFGRIVGFEPPDSFYYTQQIFTATSGQTVFSVTRAAGYISGQCWVMKNGLILNTSEYTDTGGSTGTVTLSVGATTNDIITITSFKSTSTLSLTTTAASGTGSVATLTFASRPRAPFIVGESITVSGVTPSGYNGTYTVTACTTTTVSYANITTGAQTVAGTVIYANNTYKSFSRNAATLTNQASYTASGFTLNNGYEFLFLNGTEVNSQDYDISGQDISFIANASGDLQIIQWNQNNLSLPNGSPTNVDTFTIVGQTIYAYSYNINAFNLFSNGVLFKQGTDFTTATGSYTLANTPTTNTTIMTQQTFTRTGAV